MLTILYAECGSPRHRAILDLVAAGVPAASAARQHGLQTATVQRLVRTAARLQSFALVLTDGATRVPVADVRTSRGFLHACRAALRAYRGTFDSLELPQWQLVCGENRIALTTLRGRGN